LRKTVVYFLNQKRRRDSAISLSSVIELRDKKHLASYSDSTIGSLGPDLAAPKMHCSTTIIWWQEARRKPRDQRFTGCILPMQRMSSGRARESRAHFHNGLGTYYRTYVRIYMHARVTNRCITRRMHLVRVTFDAVWPHPTEASRNLMIRRALISRIADYGSAKYDDAELCEGNIANPKSQQKSCDPRKIFNELILCK